MKRKTISENLEVAKLMPPLKHSFSGQEFDIQKSEVLKWLVAQPEVLNYLWNNIKNNRKLVVYAPETGTWQGADYED